MELINKLEALAPFIGNTPLRKLKTKRADLFVKLEYNNLSGSVKDRAAFNIVRNAVRHGLINPHTVVTESSSGNFAIALAFILRKIGVRFIPVIDPVINHDYERKLNLLCDEVVKVTLPDKNGGYLISRLEQVKYTLANRANVYWPNQYGNPNNSLAYYHTLGSEICQSFDRLDVVFVAVSTGGTIAGLSRKLREKFPRVKIVAVDVEGSVIFGSKPAKRYISGLGSSIVPPVMSQAHVDEVVHVAQLDIIQGCKDLLDEHSIFGGGSSGAVYWAVKEAMLAGRIGKADKVLFVSPDKGDAYMDTIYNPLWVNMITEKMKCEEVLA
jgi:cysteine synthase A